MSSWVFALNSFVLLTQEVECQSCSSAGSRPWWINSTWLSRLFVSNGSVSSILWFIELLRRSNSEPSMSNLARLLLSFPVQCHPASFPHCSRYRFLTARRIRGSACRIALLSIASWLTDSFPWSDSSDVACEILDWWPESWSLPWTSGVLNSLQSVYCLIFYYQLQQLEKYLINQEEPEILNKLPINRNNQL